VAKKVKEVKPTGVRELDALESLVQVSLQDYVNAVSAYIRQSSSLPDGEKKSAQIRLSRALARSIAFSLGARVPRLKTARTTETKVAGGLRTVNADVSESDELDGLRLAIELKPVNLAVGRAIWNRFGDLRAFAVNIHLKFPFCVVGGVLTVPTQELIGTKAAADAERIEAQIEEGETPLLTEDDRDDPEETANNAEGGRRGQAQFKATHHLIKKAIERLMRSGGRETEADAPHHLEAIAVVAYDPTTATIDSSMPAPGSGLVWDEFLDRLAQMYLLRFEDA
jgi:hypothetical protein